MPIQSKKKLTRRSGATIVEVAVCLPVLIMLLFAGYEFGRATMLRHASESAAYEGARTGMVPGANKRKVNDAVREMLSSMGVSDAEVIVTPAVIKQDTESVKVVVRIPMKSNTVLMSLFTQKVVFEGQCELTREVF